MSSVSSVRALSADLSSALQQSINQVMSDMSQTAEKLDRKKESVIRSSVEQVQKSNQATALRAEIMNKIDIHV